VRRIKPVSLLAALAVSAATLLCWTMTWFIITLDESDAVTDAINVTGETAAPALAALGLAGLALVAALAIAGHVFRIILGVLQAAIGGSVVWSALSAIIDPIGVSASLITETTGIAGTESVKALVGSVDATFWPVATLTLGVLTILCGIFIVSTSRRWPQAASRYQATRFEETDAPRSSISDWDSLSDGSDPTSR
jgi:uncharacterized membrane protein (TIGR02234 family)